MRIDRIIQEVPAKISWWNRQMINLGYIALVVIVLGAIYIIRKLLIQI